MNEPWTMAAERERTRALVLEAKAIKVPRKGALATAKSAVAWFYTAVTSVLGYTALLWISNGGIHG